MRRFYIHTIILWLVLIMTLPLFARTRLVVLPEREATLVRLADGLPTLVQEKRVLTLSKGENRVDFSWQNVAIDPSSIILAIPDAGPEDARLLSVSYPPGENALVWEVYSSKNQALSVVISYLLGGIDHLVAHDAMVNADETRMDLSSHLILRNFSGETFDRASVFLEGGCKFTATSRHGETKRLKFSRVSGIPIVKQYTWDAQKTVHVPDPRGPVPGIPTGYRIENTASAGLGKGDLFEGKARVFQKDGNDSTIFSGENRLPLVPPGGSCELIIGDSRDILVTRRQMETSKTNVRKNKKGRVQVWDEIRKDRLVIENFKVSPVTLTLVDIIQGQWEPIKMGHPYEKRDHQTLAFTIDLAPGQKKTIDLEYRRLNLFAGQFSRYNRLID